LISSVAAASEARALAHEAFLRASAGLEGAIAEQIAFQMRLVEVLVAGPELPAATDERPSPPEARERPFLDREQCLEFAVGSIARVLGPEFAAVDAHLTRVRLPAEPLMLVDRIVSIDAEPRSMTGGRLVTEHDVFPDAWYLDGGKTPPCIAIESGQADLFLSAYLGVDFETRGEAVYRLLDAAVVFHRGLPAPGEVVRYEIEITGFFRQGDARLFRFHFDASVDGAPLLSMRDGCAGFFTPEALAAGQGIVRRPLDLAPRPGKAPDDWSPPAPMTVGTIDAGALDALRRGDLESAFGPAFSGLRLIEPLRPPGGRMALIDRVTHLDPAGGRCGLGLIRSELDVAPDAWFLTSHFVDDMVMPGTLMYECCLHTLRVFMLRMGWIVVDEGAVDGVGFEPVVGVASRLRCRGQVVGSTGKAVFEIAIKEVGYGPEPYATADALMFADGKPIVEVADMTLKLSGVGRADVDRIWAGRRAPATASAPVFTREQVLAFASGKPSDAFGAPYRPFDEDRFIARLPAPPYSFLDRVVWTDAAPFVMAAGGSAVAEYDAPPDAWYFAADRQSRMPFAVIQEVALQACGWMAAYMGSALTSDEDLAFRNLGGSAEALVEVGPDAGTLSTRATAVKVSRSGGMIIQHYTFETTAAGRPVYRGETYFGFFVRQALADQIGIRDAAPYRLTAEESARSEARDYPRAAPFPDDRLRMIDRIDAYVADGGPHGLGVVVGSAAVDPSAWYFDAHFHGDPVCPGSLGLESCLQLLRFVGFQRWGDGRFEAVGLGDRHRWLYRGQVVPTDGRVVTRAVVTDVDDARRRLTADAFLEVDGRVIYQMNDFSIRRI
jgi:3-hydroxymyristoyl/3-hydroxydecanoyl-(acyl carrier protein) dehydratase